jgi:diadenylate cyclase
MGSLQSLYNQVIFLLSSLTWFGRIDLLLVTTVFYFLLSLVRRSSAAYLVREILLFGLTLFILTVILPFPVFDWLAGWVLVAILVAAPIIFQAQLRRFIERMGRTAGITRAVHQNTLERILPELIHAIEAMSDSRTGALIVLEGNDSLEEIAKSGIPSGGQVTSELLQSIFYSGTPLHDGAVIIRADQIVAAGCVLPLTQQALHAEKRLGTRHRAAVGMSETSDALIIIVSEETGHVSIAHAGKLLRPLSSLELREKLLDFYDPSTVTQPHISLWELIGQISHEFWHPSSLIEPRKLLSNLGWLFISLLLTLVIWSFVIEQTNPFQLSRIDNIPLRVENVPANTRVIPAPPAVVSAVVQTTEDVLPTLSPRSFQALVSLEDPEPGLYRLPIQVNSGEARVLVLSVDPPSLDFELAPVISRTLPVTIMIPDQQSLSVAYELVGAPAAFPDQIQVIGPEPLVMQIDQLQTAISLANVNTSIRETRPVRALDDQGREISGLTFQPNQIQVNVAIRRRLNARDVSVRARVEGTPPAGYQLSNLSVTPANVTLQGSVEQLADLGSIVNTSPVDVSQATTNLTIQVPLDLPPNVQATDNNGNSAKIVTVVIGITPLEGNLAVTRPVKLLKVTPNITVTIEPPEVDLLLDGPLPILNNIQANPGLVQVLVDVTELRQGQSAQLEPILVAPDDIEAQIVPPSVLVTFQQGEVLR